jgi:hypothetical protein
MVESRRLSDERVVQRQVLHWVRSTRATATLGAAIEVRDQGRRRHVVQFPACLSA